MRSRQDVRISHRHNQTKLLILKELAHPQCWLTSDDIAELCDLKPNNASRQLTKLTNQGYVWRRDIGRKSHRYRHLKPMGERVLHKLWVRQWLMDKTGDDNIDLNLEHTIPDEVKMFISEAEQEFSLWFCAR